MEIRLCQVAKSRKFVVLYLHIIILLLVCLGTFFCIFCILMQILHTKFLALAIASVTFSAPLPRPLAPMQCSFLGPLYSLCALCIMRHVVQMKIKNTSGNFCLNPQHRLCLCLGLCPPLRAMPCPGFFSIWRWKHLAFLSLSIFTLVPKQFVRLSAHAFLGT